MIKHLLKQDLKKMSKILIYMHVITLAFAVLTFIARIWKDIAIVDIISLVLAGFTYSGIISVIVNTFVHIIKNVVSTFYKDESYLTHTLPVKKSELLVSKYLSAIILVVIAVVVSIISLFLALYSPENMEFLKNFLSTTITGFNVKTSTFIGLVAILFFVQTCMLITLAFTGIIKGYSYGEKRILKGLIWFFVIYAIQNVIMILVAVITLAIMGRAHELLMEVPSIQTLITVFIIGIVLNVVYSITLFAFSKHEFSKGVNVD